MKGKVSRRCQNCESISAESLSGCRDQAMYFPEEWREGAMSVQHRDGGLGRRPTCPALSLRPVARTACPAPQEP